MKPYRTVLSVPGHKPSWFDKGVAAGADCLCLDLEDSVPEAEKENARQGIAEAIRRISSSHPKVGLFVRPNALDTGATGDDLSAVVVPGLTGVFAPKVGSAIDVHKYDALVDYFEHRNKVTGIEYILPIETIEGIQHCEEIGQASPRVGALIGATAEHADIARAVGYEWTPEGTESRYHRTRIMLAMTVLFLVTSYPIFAAMVAYPSLATAILAAGWLSLVKAGYSGVLPSLLSELFPTETRAIGMSFSYSVSVTIFGGFAPFVATWLITQTGDKLSPSFYLMATAVLSMIAIIAAGRRLPARARRGQVKV